MFCHTLNGCPRRTSRTSSTSGTRQRPTPRIRGVLAHKPLPPPKKKHRGRSKSTSTAKGYRTLPEETANKVQTCPKSGSSGPPKQMERRRGGKDLTEIPWCQYCSVEHVMGTTFFVCDAQQQNLSKKQNGASSDFTQAGFEHIQSLTQLEIRPQKPRGNIHKQNGAQLQTAGPNFTVQRQSPKVQFV